MISVALCTYNGEKYIEEQLSSILSQSVPVDEIIICDDRSADNTVDVIKKTIEKLHTKVDIRVNINDKNKGVAKNFEGALNFCSGDIIFLSDQDDIWEPNKVEKMLGVFESDPDCLFVFSDAYLVDSKGKSLGKSLWDLTRPVLKQNYHVTDFTGARFVTGATAAIRRELLEHGLPIPNCWIHDAWLAAVASVFGKIQYLNEKLIFYRQHENNVIGAKKRGLIAQFQYTKNNIRKSIEFRKTMKERFSALYDAVGDRIADAEKEALLECMDFWADSERIQKGSKRKGLETILRNLSNGNYKRYNHGVYGAMVDLFILVKT